METSTAIFTSIGFLCIMSLGFAYKFLSRYCRQQEVDLRRVSSVNKQPDGAEHNCMAVQVATASPQLCSYKTRRLLASFPSLDRFLCNSLSWQEGVTLESGLENISSFNHRNRANTTPARQPGKDDKENGINNNHGTHKTKNGAVNSNTQSSGIISASTQTNGARVNSCTRNLAHSILNIVSAIPDVSLGSFSQSLPNVQGCLAESVSTSTGSRDLVVLWSTTLESSSSGILTSTRVE